MSQESNLYPTEPEFSFKKLMADRVSELKYLMRFKKQLLIALVFGVFAGAATAWMWPVSYSSRLTFLIEDSKPSGGSLLSGLAGQFGFDIGGLMGGTSGVLAGDNVMGLLTSERMIKSTLLTPFPGKKDYSLADQYADAYNLKPKWTRYTKNNELVMFPVNHDHYSRLQDSLLQDMVIRINEKNISIGKPDKKLGFYELDVTTKNETLSRLFSLRIIEKAAAFYIQAKTRPQRLNVNMLQRRVDSLGMLLNRKTYSSSAANQILLDANPAYPTTNVGVELQERDKLILQTNYGETYKSLEISKVMLMQETPTFQIVDTPDLPLKKNQIKYPKGIILGMFFSMVIYSLYLLIFRKQPEKL